MGGTLGTLKVDLPDTVDLKRQFLSLDKPITAVAPQGTRSANGDLAVVVAADNNPRELVREAGAWSLRSHFSGLPDFFTQLPRVVGADFNADGVADVQYAFRSSSRPEQAPVIPAHARRTELAA